MSRKGRSIRKRKNDEIHADDEKKMYERMGDPSPPDVSQDGQGPLTMVREQHAKMTVEKGPEVAGEAS